MLLKIGVCGKREIADKDKAHVAGDIEKSIREILAKYRLSHFVGYTGLAKGADTIFAEVVSSVFKQPIHVVLPFQMAEFEKDFTDTADIEMLTALTAIAGKTDIISANPVNNEDRNKAYFEAGKYIVDNCNEMIFIWDELKPRGIGGTAEIMGYYSEKINRSELPYIPVPPKKEDPLHNQLKHEYDHYNRCAIQNQKSYKKIWKSAILLGWLAVTLFAVSTGFHLEEMEQYPVALILVICESLLVLYVYYKINTAQKKNYHGKYITERMRAETLRILEKFYHADVKITILFSDKKDKTLVTAADKINKAIDSKHYRSRWYANYAIKKLIIEQQQYHEKKINSIGNKALHCEKINFTIAILFLISVLAHLIATAIEFLSKGSAFAQHIQEIEKIIVFFNIFLPASYAAVEGVLYFQEWEILKKYSETAKQSLEKSLAELPLINNEDDEECCIDKQCSTLNTISATMLTDNKNWELLIEDKNKYQFVI